MNLGKIVTVNDEIIIGLSPDSEISGPVHLPARSRNTR